MLKVRIEPVGNGRAGHPSFAGKKKDSWFLYGHGKWVAHGCKIVVVVCVCFAI